MYRHLIDQAEVLVTLDTRGKPRQANLRRAVSSTYYALFHYLIGEAVRSIIGTQHSRKGYRYALSRAFVHTSMRSACASFSASQLPDPILKSLPRDANGNYSIPTEIRNIARTFKELQHLRHLADYDLSEQFRRSEVRTVIEQVENQVEDFVNLTASDERQFFLICLLVWKELTNR